MNLKDIYWLAGLLEGEGCFGIFEIKRPNGDKNIYPHITLHMNDLDVIERASKIWKGTVVEHNNTTSLGYRTRIQNREAVQWMMMLYPLMCSRRKAKIRTVIKEWKEIKSKPLRTHCKRGHLLPVSRRCDKCEHETYIARKAIKATA